MQLETKFMRLRTPVTIGSRFGDWKVTWLGGWTRCRLCYLVMVVRVKKELDAERAESDQDDHQAARTSGAVATSSDL
jgi:hypothetical protein